MKSSALNTCPVRFFQQILTAVQEDFSALIPGSRTPFNVDTVLRLVLYAGLLIFAFRLFYAGLSATPELNPFQHEEGRPRSGPSVENPRNI